MKKMETNIIFFGGANNETSKIERLRTSCDEILVMGEWLQYGGAYGMRASFFTGSLQGVASGLSRRLETKVIKGQNGAECARIGRIAVPSTSGSVDRPNG